LLTLATISLVACIPICRRGSVSNQRTGAQAAGLKSGRSQVWRNVLAVIAAAVIIGGGAWLGSGAMRSGGTEGGSQASQQAGVEQGGAEIGRLAPLLNAPGIDGTTVDLEELRGKPVWIVFGATWCPNCRSESADVETVAQAQGQDAAVVAVYVGQTESTVVDYADRLGLTFPQVADPNSELGAAWGVMALPTHVFLDADGRVSAIDLGGMAPETANRRLREASLPTP
jgi:peroxiredoxin